MFGLLIEYLSLTGINIITERVNAEPGWVSSFEKGQDKAIVENITPIIVTRA